MIKHGVRGCTSTIPSFLCLNASNPASIIEGDRQERAVLLEVHPSTPTPPSGSALLGITKAVERSNLVCFFISSHLTQVKSGVQFPPTAMMSKGWDTSSFKISPHHLPHLYSSS